MDKLTPKQEKFVVHIVEGLSQREAYIRAGYSTEGKTDEYIDKKACELFANGKVKGRYKELMNEHKDKALWTREEAVRDLIWIKNQSRRDIEVIGVKQANSNAFINAIKELNVLEDLYPKDVVTNDTQENEIADMLRKMVDRDGA